MVEMTTNNFINRYFESEAILLKIEYLEKRSMTTFMNYLENLHSVADKLKDRFGCNIKNVPEFKRDLLCSPENVPVMTTEGLVFSKSRESVKKDEN